MAAAGGPLGLDVTRFVSRRMIDARTRHDEIAHRRLLLLGAQARRLVVDAEIGQALRQADAAVGNGDAIKRAQQALADRRDIDLAVEGAPGSEDPVALHDHDRGRFLAHRIVRNQLRYRSRRRSHLGLAPMRRRLGRHRRNRHKAQYESKEQAHVTSFPIPCSCRRILPKMRPPPMLWADTFLL